MSKKTIIILALMNNWKIKEINSQEAHFTRKGIDLIVNFIKKTYKTTMIHPKNGPTTLVRSKLSQNEIIHILNNPRTHTGKGTHEYDEIS